MVPQWKRWLGAASVLLLAGAGCQGAVQQEASTSIEAEATGETEDDGTMMIEAEASLEVEADAAVDAMLKESEDDAMTEYEEGSDADVIVNDKAELDAYGQAYDKTEL